MHASTTTHFERLSAQDRSFLVFEGHTTPMHVGAALLLDVGLPRSATGDIDIARIRRHVAARLDLLPRYRQRLTWTPLWRYPVWIDDSRFDVRYHVRHTSLPRPGSVVQLRELTARLMSQPLDQQRPLWQLWVVEGLDGNRSAIVIKVHHCVIDGTSGVELLTALMTPTAEPDTPCESQWVARAKPSTVKLLRDEIRHHIGLPVAAVAALRTAVRDPRQLAQQVAALWSGVRETATVALQPVDKTPLNQSVGSARRVSWTRLELAAVKQVKNRVGGTVNDVVVATVAGALRQLLRARGVNVDQLHLRATVPVNVRGAGEHAAFGNRVSAWLVELPVGERDPLRRVTKVTALTSKMKRSSQARLIELLTDAAAGFDPLLTLGARLAAYLSPYTLIITNLVGPPFPLYFLGARMLEAYPFAPLFHNQGLAVGVFSYNGDLYIGCNADWDSVPDVDAFATAIRRAFAQLERATTRALPVRGQAPVRRARKAVAQA